LEELGVISSPTPEPQRMVSGVVRRENGKPVQGSVVRAFHEEGINPIRLGDGTTDAEGHYAISYNIPPNVAAIHLKVVVINVDGAGLFESDVIKEAKT
jgi:hypothetical protein